MGWKQDVVLVKYPHTETLCALWTSTDPSCLSATSTHQKEKLGGFTECPRPGQWGQCLRVSFFDALRSAVLCCPER